MQVTLGAQLPLQRNSTGHVILAAGSILVVASQGHLVAEGLAPTAHPRSPRATDIDVVGIANSLQLREVLRVTTTVSESPQLPGSPPVH